MTQADSTNTCPGKQPNRRTFLAAANGLALGAVGASLFASHWERGRRADVFIAKADNYQSDLAAIIRSGLAELGITATQMRGKSVLLKPNLVEPSRDAPHVNTNPLMIRAAAEVFQALGAERVLVAEGQGHMRDTYLVLEASRVGPVLQEDRIRFVDLNHDDIVETPNRLNRTKMASLYLPKAISTVDFIVSMPKMKTHHWTGVTLAMKNFFGVMPGICYGWPKNVLHQEGIIESILDINATVRPHLAIVDGIVGMEGDGPIMGTSKPAGVIVIGTNLPAVDATATRVMGLDPWRVRYLREASGILGPIHEHNIQQRGETIASVRTSFSLLNHPQFTAYPS